MFTLCKFYTNHLIRNIFFVPDISTKTKFDSIQINGRTTHPSKCAVKLKGKNIRIDLDRWVFFIQPMLVFTHYTKLIREKSLVILGYIAANSHF